MGHYRSEMGFEKADEARAKRIEEMVQEEAKRIEEEIEQHGLAYVLAAHFRALKGHAW